MERESNSKIGDYNSRHSKAAESQSLMRMTIIAPLFRKGCTYREMADEVKARLGIETYAISTVKKDVDRLLKEWRETRIENTDLQVQLELQRIDQLVREAWDAWDKSKEDYQKQRARQDGIPTEEGEGGEGGVAVVRVSQEREDVRACGDPRYIDTINKLLQERRKLLGLYSPEKKAITTDFSFADALMMTGVKKND